MFCLIKIRLWHSEIAAPDKNSTRIIITSLSSKISQKESRPMYQLALTLPEINEKKNTTQRQNKTKEDSSQKPTTRPKPILNLSIHKRTIKPNLLKKLHFLLTLPNTYKNTIWQLMAAGNYLHTTTVRCT